MLFLGGALRASRRAVRYIFCSLQSQKDVLRQFGRWPRVASIATAQSRGYFLSPVALFSALRSYLHSQS